MANNTPFNINEFLKGQPVVTKSGVAIDGLREVKYKGGDIYITALVNGVPFVWTTEGVVLNSSDHTLDLQMAPAIVYKWVKKKNIETVEPADLKGYVKIIVA